MLRSSKKTFPKMNERKFGSKRGEACGRDANGGPPLAEASARAALLKGLPYAAEP